MTSKNMRNSLFAVTMATIVLAGEIPGTSVADSALVNLTVNVNVVEAPCHINGDSDTPTVEFGDVRVDLIDGTQYAQPLAVAITCDSAPQGNLQYELKGDATNFDGNVLKTHTDGLGIKVLKADGSTLAVNTWTDISQGQTINLKVVPVKDGATVLVGGEFNAEATLVLQIK